KWESFIITVIKNPLPNVPQALVIVGSDARGTAFGVFEVSKQMGVSPWYWWADVIPEKKSAIFIHGTQLNGPPSVQYRGIFLNDEDWGLQPWAAKKMDADIKDIGPNTYAHIFELLLRLKANYIWPAMHPCTKAFYYYKDNAKLADKYAIVVGTSHCEPMLRNNVFEWAENYKKEYGTDPKEWRYDLNKEQIAPYWQDRITEVKNYESVVTVGMRGIHDGSMPGPKDINAKVKLLETVIEDQRKILQNTYQKPINTIPQIFCPYKEVLQLYRKGMKLPNDVTIAWADDNYGYITQLSDTKERQRSGGSGVYYHLSYWGAPQDYLWLSTHSPSLISYEMTKAFDFNAKRLWVFNVGDLKPAEMELNFALDLAYNINKWQPTNAINYSEFWAEEIFGKAFAKPIAAIKTVFYQLAQEGKPEHLGMINYSNEIADKRIADYKGITEQSEALFTKMPDRLKDAFYELVLYPVKGAYLMNQKVFFAKRSIESAKQGNRDALTYSRLSEAAYKSIQNITNTYNKNIANGKWDGIMSSHPRDLEVFKMPKVATKEMVDSNKNNLSNTIANIKQPTIILATDFRNKKNILGKNITIINGLGISGKGITVLPFTALSSDTLHLEKVPYVDYQITLSKGNHSISIKALPTHSINQEYKVRYAISVNGDRPQIINLEAEASSKIWSKNVVNGFSSATTLHTILLDTISTIRLYILEPGVVINQLEIL
ncbi:MAG: glycosyl hydrolase 115 family protein, partial [Pedobacter sp.]|nr:glycosyl hydrolase 115 family protein [Chitinophagaceae bacterium]